MQYFPKNTKYKKSHKGNNFNLVPALRDFNFLKFGSIGLKSISKGKVSSKQIEAFKQCINKIIKKTGRVYVKVFAFTPVTKKPLEVRMGKGKGAVNHWVSKVQSGIILCEIEINNFFIGKKALEAAKYRLPIKTKIIF
jgi:large subunit ribosomal protein L16